MKKIFFIACALAATACIDKGEDVTPNGDGKVDMDNLISTQTYDIPVKDGMITVVKVGDDTVATASVPTRILLPKSVTAASAQSLSRADATPLKLSYVPLSEENKLGNANSFSVWQVIAFEDSRKGDYDYNDLVIHVCCETRGGNYSASGYAPNGEDRQLAIGIQPIALGSTKNIALGCNIYQGDKMLTNASGDTDIMITDNCRDFFFNGAVGATNTGYNNGDEGNKDYCTLDYAPYFGSNYLYFKSNSTEAISVNWFIIVDNNVKLYAASTENTVNVLDSNNRPYGIVITHTGDVYTGNMGRDWFNYPKEGVRIDTVYPQFGAWLSGEFSGVFSDIYHETANTDKIFPAIENDYYLIPSNQANAFKKPTSKAHVIPLRRTRAEIDDPAMKF